MFFLFAFVFPERVCMGCVLLISTDLPVVYTVAPSDQPGKDISLIGKCPNLACLTFSSAFIMWDFVNTHKA